MSFSIRRAAQEAGNTPALVTALGTWSYQDLLRRVEKQLREEKSGPRSAPALVTAEAAPEVVVRLLALLETGRPAVLLHPRWSARETAAAVALAAGPLAPPGASPPQAVVFTSGTGGPPKGVALSGAALAASAEASARRLGWEAEDRWLLALPPAHVGGLSILTRCLAARKTVVLASPRDPGGMWECMERAGVTLVSLVPAQLSRLLRAEPRLEVPRKLRAVLLGGGPSPPALLEEARRRGWPVLPTYGLSETCSQVATVAPGTAPDPRQGAGLPLPGIEVRIALGRILVRGPVLLDRYLPPGRWDHPVDGAGWLATGDLGHLDEAGRLHVTGRADALIVSGGEKISPEEVELELLALPGVEDAGVCGVPDPAWGEIVAAAVVPAGKPELTFDRLAGALAERLAAYKIPRRWLLVDAVPRNPLGKIDRAGLRVLAMRLAG